MSNGVCKAARHIVLPLIPRYIDTLTLDIQSVPLRVADEVLSSQWLDKGYMEGLIMFFTVHVQNGSTTNGFADIFEQLTSDEEDNGDKTMKAYA